MDRSTGVSGHVSLNGSSDMARLEKGLLVICWSWLLVLAVGYACCGHGSANISDMRVAFLAKQSAHGQADQARCGLGW